jgi:hypothetical protein
MHPMTSFLFNPRIRSAARWLCVLLVCPHLATADVTTTPGDKKKKKDDQEFLPEAKPINARFIAGIPVDIELNAATAKPGPVRFAIREQPQHGTLSAIRAHPTESYKAIVTYTPNRGDASLVDRFTYACKLEVGSWSASSIVSLIGKRADPKVEIMQTPSFGRVLPGFEGSSRILLKNTGIAPFAADIQWQAPWLGPPRIELGIGEQKEFLITVKPTAPGTLIWETELQHGEPLSKVRLYVECTEPFVVAPGQLKLHYDGAKGDRRGKVGVANSTDLPMKLTIEPPANLRAPKEIEVPPKQSVDVEVSLSPEDVNVFRGELWVINEPYRQRVLIDAAPEPPQAVLVLPKEGAIDFGTVPKGKTVQSKVVLQNVGGEAAVLSAQAAPPFRVVESDAAVSIGPGQSREMVVEGVSGQAGKFTGNIIFSGTGGRLSIAARLSVIDPSTPQPIRPMSGENPRNQRVPVAKASGGLGTIPAPGVAKAPKQESTAAKTTPDPKPDAAVPAEPGKLAPLTDTQAAVFGYLATYGLPVLKSMVSPHLQKIDGIEFIEQGREHLVLAWKEPADKPESYLLEQGYSVMNQPTGRWLKGWREMPNVEKIEGEAGKHTVRITKLVPNSRYEFRVLGVDENGKVSEPSDIHFFSTAPPWHFPWWTTQALVALALVIFAYIYVRIRRGDWEFGVGHAAAPVEKANPLFAFWSNRTRGSDASSQK